MKQLVPGDRAPNFTLPDHEGTLHSLSDINKDRNILLIFNVGFV